MKALETLLAIVAGLLIAGIAILVIGAIGLAICEWRIYRKLGLPGWVALVPFYNFIKIGEVLGLEQLAIAQCIAFGLSFVPYIGPLFGLISTVLYFIVQYYTIVALGSPDWFILLALFIPIVYYPIMAFSDG